METIALQCSEAQLRHIAEKQMKELSIDFIKIEPGNNASFGIPDYNITYNNKPMWIELKLAKKKHNSQLYHSNIRANQKKQLRKLSKTPDTAAGLLVAKHNSKDIYAVLFFPEIYGGDFDFDLLIELKIAIKIENIIQAIDFFYNSILIRT